MLKRYCIPLNKCDNDDDDSSSYFIFIERNDGSAVSLIAKLVDNRLTSVTKDFDKTQFVRDTLTNAVAVMTELELLLFKCILYAHCPFADCPEIKEKNEIINFIKYKEFYGASVILNEVAQNWYLVQPIFLDICKYTKNVVSQEVMDNITNVDALYEHLLRIKDEEEFQAHLKNISSK